MGILAQLATIENIGTLATLEKLAEVYGEAHRMPQGSVPFTTLFLKSGLSLRGQVLALSSDAGPRSVLFLIYDPKAQEAVDLTYVIVDEVAAVTIHNAIAMINALSDGRIGRPGGPAPSRGEIAGALTAMIDELNEICEGEMTADIGGVPENSPPEVLHAIALTARDLYATLRKIASEELGRQALREKSFKFSFRLGEEPGVHVNRAQFHVSIGVQGNRVDRVSRESLRVNIEEFL